VNKNKILTAACFVSLIASSSLPAFQLPQLPGQAASTPAAAAPATGGDQLVAAYTGADQEVLAAQSKFADALGLKDKAAEFAATAAALGSGSTSANDLSKVESKSTAAEADIAQAMKSNVTLSDTAKQTYIDGLKHLAVGTTKTVALKDNAMAFGNAAQAQIAAASIVDKLSVTNKLAPGMYVAQHLPGHLVSLGTTLKSAVDFAKSHDIPVPADATSALSAL